jgi:hypothetical protein
MKMTTLTQSIMEHAEAQPAGTALSAKQLLHLGSRAGIDQALSRLVAAGGLLRVGRGLYVSPVRSRFGSHPPKAAQVVASVVAAKGGEMASHGAAAANTLGLTTQVPTSAVYATTGRSRTLNLGRQIVELRHAPSWQFVVGGLAGEAVRALAWLGEKRGEEAIGRLRSKLTGQEREALLHARSSLPTWMAKQVSALA